MEWDDADQDTTVLRNEIEQEARIMPNGKANPGPGWRLGTVWGDFLQDEGSLAGMTWTRSGMQHAWNRDDQVAGRYVSTGTIKERQGRSKEHFSRKDGAGSINLSGKAGKKRYRA